MLIDMCLIKKFDELIDSGRLTFSLKEGEPAKNFPDKKKIELMKTIEESCRKEIANGQTEIH